MVDLMDLAIASCMRLGEICRICWNDVDVTDKTVVIRDRKDPRKKIGNHQTVPLLGEPGTLSNGNQKAMTGYFPTVTIRNQP